MNKPGRNVDQAHRVPLKLHIVHEIEHGLISVTVARAKYSIRGKMTILNWLRQYGKLNWEDETPSSLFKLKLKKVLELSPELELSV
ncbi:hypothetical protein [Carboxylicivirga sp. M1479]|uniref:hypothetical protein n=1 Tax=Carboxylicivirga sp. M1479 TaxID=2594476 RepID=UPI0011788E89|nr:hypothetical protein [Carboxylicivirga sp. M1479]TRX71567.1 hypothetical protein FNN09_06230 [Carboxylicivirga sp. M1479]